MKNILKEGDIAPDFTFINRDGELRSNKDLLGKKVVLYFYPKDNTPGCTKEAHDFVAMSSKFESKNTVIIGVSKDNEVSHKKFAEKFSIKYPLIADVETNLCQAYGVLVEKSMFGKKYFGIERATFLINEAGIIEKVWNKVKVSGHVNEVLSIL